MDNAKLIETLRSIIESQLKTKVIDPFPSMSVVRGREFVAAFKSSRKLWFRLVALQLEQVTQIRCDEHDFCTGPDGSCFDWDDGRVQLLEFDNPMIVVIVGAWEED